MRVNIIYDAEAIKVLIEKDILSKFNLSIEIDNIICLVKTKQNYKAEWEAGQFRFELNEEI